jgi:drug/metabolite transporter (DMT)-like permease
VMTPVLAVFLLRKPYSLRHLPIQLAVVAGLYLLCGRGGLSGYGAGEVLALLTALAMALSLVLGQKSLAQMDAVTLTAVQTGGAAAAGVLCALLFNGGCHLAETTPMVWGVIVYLGVVCTFLGFFLQNAALTALPARTVALGQSLCPVMTALFSRLLLSERLSAAGLAGAGIITLCVAAECLLPDGAELPPASQPETAPCPADDPSTKESEN